MGRINAVMLVLIIFNEQGECFEIILFVTAERAFITDGQSIDDATRRFQLPITVDRADGEFIKQLHVSSTDGQGYRI
jgi:hypothetical protein